MMNIKDFEAFCANAYELINERDNLEEMKKVSKEVGTEINDLYDDEEIKGVTFITKVNDYIEDEEELNNRILLFEQKWQEYIEDCFKQSPFLFYLKYTIGINNIKDKEDRQKVEDYERKIVEYTELAARLYPELEGISKGKQKTLSR